MSSPEKRALLWHSSENPYEGAMRFRLTYEGKLLGASRTNSRAAHKHEIRMVFHKQLKRLWQRHSGLVELSQKQYPDYETAVAGVSGGPFAEKTSAYPELVSSRQQQHGHNWLPLVLEDVTITCALDVLFLRAGSRGNLLNVDDIDGRLKTLFDALSIPKNGSGVTPPEPDEDVSYVLLQDDRLISHVSVESDELLEPTGKDEIQNDARLVITVDVRMTQPNWMSLRFSGH